MEYTESCFQMLHEECWIHLSPRFLLGHPNLSSCWFYIHYISVCKLVGGIPTPLKNISQLGWWHSQLIWTNHPVMFQSPPSSISRDFSQDSYDFCPHLPHLPRQRVIRGLGGPLWGAMGPWGNHETIAIGYRTYTTTMDFPWSMDVYGPLYR